MATDTEQRVAIRNKAVGTYSQHPKTAAERKRYADMTPEQDARNKKRRATNEAVKRVRYPTKCKAGFDSLPPTEQQVLLANAEARIREKRHVVSYFTTCFV